MSLASTVIDTAERVPLPDVVIRAAIQLFCSRTATWLASRDRESDAALAHQMAARPIAEHAGAANAQHYEVPAAFFAHVLGPNRKYSSCFYKEEASTLQEAEEEALRQTVEHADLAEGQQVLELGCNWGSLSMLNQRFRYIRLVRRKEHLDALRVEGSRSVKPVDWLWRHLQPRRKKVGRKRNLEHRTCLSRIRRRYICTSPPCHYAIMHAWRHAKFAGKGIATNSGLVKAELGWSCTTAGDINVAFVSCNAPHVAATVLGIADGQPNPFVNPGEFNAYAATLEKAFEEGLAKQTAAAQEKKG